MIRGNFLAVLIVAMCCVPLLLSSSNVPENDKSLVETYLRTGLPLVRVITENSEEPTCDYVMHPEGYAGASITNATKVPGKLLILSPSGEEMYNSGDYSDSKSGMTIRIRGNTSAWAVKKPYKVKLQKKADLLLRGNEDKFGDKDWLLLRSGGRMEYDTKYDFSLNPIVGIKLSELIGMEWTPSYMYVNLLINDSYKGVYLLVESVKRNSKCRIDVDKNEGYIFERDPYWWNEDVYFETAWTDYYRFTLKYPDVKDLQDEDLDYLSSTMNKVENSIIEGNYPNFIDCNSFATWVLAHDILGTYDGSGSNMYFSKFSRSQEDLIKMPVLWDFDSIFEMPLNSFSMIHLDSPYFPFQSSNNFFIGTYVEKYHSIKDVIYSQIISFFDNFQYSSEAKAIDESRQLELDVWGGQFYSVSQNVEVIKEWFTQRKKWLDEAITDLETNKIDRAKEDNQMKSYYYSLDGRASEKPSRGFIIMKRGNNSPKKVIY